MIDLTPIAVAIVLCVGLVTCSSREKISDAAVQANAEACQKLGRDPYVISSTSGTTITCRSFTTTEEQTK